MEDRKLLPMVEYIGLVDYEYLEDYEVFPRLESIHIYAKFLESKLNIGMFVPCDEDGNAVVPPWETKKWNTTQWRQSDADEYNKAKERVIFEGFEVEFYSEKSFKIKCGDIQPCYYKSIPEYWVWSMTTVEELTGLGVTLTESAYNKYFK